MQSLRLTEDLPLQKQICSRKAQKSSSNYAYSSELKEKRVDSITIQECKKLRKFSPFKEKELGS